MAFTLLAAGVSLALLGSCAKEQVTGTCFNSDTTVWGRNVTQSTCTNDCGPACPFAPGMKEMSVAAEPPAGAAVYTTDDADSAWTAALCTNASTVVLDVPANGWVELPVMWITTDSATAIANWNDIHYQVSVDDSIITLPDSLNWIMEPVSITCPDRTVEGVMRGQDMYFGPLTGMRRIGLTYTFSADVNDGWSTYPGGSVANYVVLLRPDTTGTSP